jgi:hypothetical protein
MLRRSIPYWANGKRGGGGTTVSNYTLAFSFSRRIDSDYAGNHLVIVRESDSAEQEFGFDGSGILDTASISSWLGASVGTVKRLYNQGNHETIRWIENTVDNDRPVIYNGTNFFIENGRYYADFSPVNAFLASPIDVENSILDKDSFYTYILKTQSSATSIQATFTEHESSPNLINSVRLWSDRRSNRVFLSYQPQGTTVNSLLLVRANPDSLRQYSGTRNGNENKIYWNQVLQDTDSSSQFFNNDGYIVMGRQTFEFQSNNFSFSGLMAEFIADRNFDEVKRDLIEDDQRTFFGI